MSKQQYPAIAVVLQDIGDAILKGKTANGDPFALAEAHTESFQTYMRGVQFSGRPIVAIDSYALDALDAITTIAMAPRREAFYALAAAGILGAAHLLTVEQAMAQGEAEKAAKEAAAMFDAMGQEPAEAEGYDPEGSQAAEWDERHADDLLDRAHAAPAKHRGLPCYIMKEGDDYPTDQTPGTLVRVTTGRGRPVLIGYIGVQGQMVEMRNCLDKPNYVETVRKLAETERELADTFAKLKAS